MFQILSYNITNKIKPPQRYSVRGLQKPEISDKKAIMNRKVQDCVDNLKSILPKLLVIKREFSKIFSKTEQIAVAKIIQKG